MKYIVSYAYDVPHYADFRVNARSRKEALRKAKQALRAGRFGDVVGQPDDTQKGERVFVLRLYEESDDLLQPI